MSTWQNMKWLILLWVLGFATVTGAGYALKGLIFLTLG